MSESAGEPIRVLHVDDDPDLAEVVSLHLERAHDTIEVRTATSASEGLDELASDEPVDCVVSDHDMPGMEGLEFLREVRADYGDLPFILFTGKGSEEIASEAISAGVTEYLQKGTGSDQYAVLANRIEWAVSERRARAALEESERMFSTLIENLPGMVYRCANEPEWPMVYVSDGCRELTGYDAGALEAGEVVWGEDVLHPDDAEDAWETVQAALAAEERFELTYRIETADDEIRWMWERGSGVYDDGDLTFLEGFITDITERRRREEQLQEERAFTEGAINALDDIFWVVEADSGEFLRWNDKLTEKLGYETTDLAGMRGRDLVAEDHRERLLEGKAEALETGRMAVEVDLVTTDGERVPVEIRGSPMHDDAGDLIGLGGVARDISDRKERERELERYRTLVESVGDPMYVLDEDGRYVMVNEAMVEQSGWDREEIIGERPVKFMDEDAVRRGTEILFDLLEDDDRRSDSFEFRPTVGDGDMVVENVIAPLTDEAGDYRGAVGVIRDISDRKERERELEQYRTLVENVGDPMYVVDPDGTIRMVNNAMAAHLGYDKAEIEGATPHKFMTADDVARGEEVIRELIAADEKDAWRTWEMDSIRADGTSIRNENMTAVIYEDGEFAGSVGVIRDIEERKQREERLEEFASVVSHDLRSPLNVIMGRLELARHQDDPEHLDRMADAADRMDQLIDDLLTLARKGQTVGETATVDLESVAEGAWRTADPADATLAVSEPGTVEADPDRLQELLENLFRNAVEHGTSGSASQTGETAADPAVDGDGEAVTVHLGSSGDGFFVADDGPGIDPEDREAVFDHGYTTSDDGTGFGLSIVKRIAEAHGWEVDLTDSADGGARFEFRP